ncbi:MAG: alpha-E domain-containing protein [Eubacteriales bacterium]|nr:alpha-E domain-containing protein [Eubacteriales bacterium]
MGFISLEQADRLFWLGRYTERVYSTIRLYFTSADIMIDEATDSYPKFCSDLDIPNVYSDKDDFLKRYPFDKTNPDSIISNLIRAYDNAIELRETIGSEPLSYIQLSIYDMNKVNTKMTSAFHELQNVIDHILAFWGIVDDMIDSEQIRNIIKAGKRIERIDLYARLGLPAKRISREINRMIPRVEKSGLKYNAEKLENLKSLVTAPEIDYYKIVSEAETIF